MASFPYMQFEQNNPLDLALKTAMDVYSIPSDLANTQAQASLNEQKSRKEKMLADLLENYQKQNFQGYGMPSMGSSGSMYEMGNNNELAEQLFRQMIGVPSEFPGEKSEREQRAYRENAIFNKNIESSMGTSSFNTQKQSMGLGIENTIPLIDELIELEVPGQGVGKYFAPNVQPKYEATVANITDKLVKAMGLSSTEESLHTVRQMIERQPRESEGSYKQRLKDLKSELLFTYGKVSGQSLEKQESNHYEKVRIQAPNGTVYMVPRDQEEAAIKAGGKRVEF